MKNASKIAALIIFLLWTSLAMAADVSKFHFLAAEKQLSIATDEVSAGYYSTTTLHAVDTDLAAGNIKKPVNIFGIVGTYEGGGGSSYGLPKTGNQPDYPPGTPFYAGDDCSYATPEALKDVGYPRGTGSWAKYNTARFTTAEPVAGEVVVIDNATGLMWVSDGNSAGCYNGSTRNWTQAIDFAEGLTFAGYDDWRLPNIIELQSIVDYGRYNPPINPTYFPNTKNTYYFSSTTDFELTSWAWAVHFIKGRLTYDNGKGNAYYVRPVRGGR